MGSGGVGRLCSAVWVLVKTGLRGVARPKTGTPEWAAIGEILEPIFSRPGHLTLYRRLKKCNPFFPSRREGRGSRVQSPASRVQGRGKRGDGQKLCVNAASRSLPSAYCLRNTSSAFGV